MEKEGLRSSKTKNRVQSYLSNDNKEYLDFMSKNLGCSVSSIINIVLSDRRLTDVAYINHKNLEQ